MHSYPAPRAFSSYLFQGAFDGDRNEKLEWQEAAALFDPRALVMRTGAWASETVPADEVWYMVNGYIVDIGGTNSAGLNSYLMHRDPNVLNALPCPPGTVLAPYTGEGLGAGIDFMAYIRPRLVTDVDDRYHHNPRALFYERMRRLKGFSGPGSLPPLVLRTTFARINRGQFTQVTEDFTWTSANIQYGILRNTWQTNAAWMAFYGSDAAGLFTAWNLDEENNNNLGQSFTGRRFVPFIRKQSGAIGFSGIKLAGGNSAGDAGNSDLDVHGGAQWWEVPLDPPW